MLFYFFYSPSLEYPVFFINWIQPALLSVIVLSQLVSQFEEGQEEEEDGWYKWLF